MEPLGPLHEVPFDQKWELLKPIIERLYIREKKELSDVIKAIRDEYGFDAVESQYKYQINRKWKLKKNISTSKKAALCQVIQKRAQLGKSSTITRQGQDFDTKNLRRYLKTERRAITLQPGAGEPAIDSRIFSGHITLSGNRIFMNWNMLYGAIVSSEAKAIDHPSPLSDIEVTTPASPRRAPSPIAVAVREITAMERSRLFLQGRQMDLFNSIEIPQRIALSTWAYQFWLFAFTTAKHWERGPQDWTANMLGFDDYYQQTTVSSPNTPVEGQESLAFQRTPRDDETNEPVITSTVKIPSSLCFWSIHYCTEEDLDAYCDFNRASLCNCTCHEGNWPTWPGSHDKYNYTEKLSNGLENNNFSNVKLNDLPIAVAHVAEAARRSPKELLEEALGFSIMSRNGVLMMNILKQFEDRSEIPGLYPFHLAVSYLDGSRTCCRLLQELIFFSPRFFHKLYINDLGHTILDQLMIAILKAHTSCLPSVVDVSFKNEKRFEGENVDICGRWNADSDCIRTLFLKGISGIPFEWKHMFCHTSVQTICHCIWFVFRPYWGADINAASGLFVRHCSHCGLKLQPLPLHTLILVGLHLSRSGCKNENLFGILACLLCLLSNGANPLLKADISVQALLGYDEANECSHMELDPAGLAEAVSTNLKMSWSRELTTGWKVICYVLKRSQAEWRVRSSKRQSTSNKWEHDDDDYDMFIRSSGGDSGTDDDDDDMSIRSSGGDSSTDDEASNEHHLPADCSDHERHKNFFGGSKVLASLWAAVQTELLTYRRLEEGDEWISPNFNMHTLYVGLIIRDMVDVGLVQKEMIKPFCDCGQFSSTITTCPTTADAAAYDFSNLDDINRACFTKIPNWLSLLESLFP